MASARHRCNQAGPEESDSWLTLEDANMKKILVLGAGLVAKPLVKVYVQLRSETHITHFPTWPTLKKEDG